MFISNISEFQENYIIKRSTLVYPLFYILLYSILTILIFRYGVIKYPTQNNFKLYLFLTATHIFLIIGYLSGLKIRIRSKTDTMRNGDSLLFSFYKKCIIISIITFIPEFIIYSGAYNYSLSEIISRIIVGLVNPAINYKEDVTGLPNRFWSLINYMVILTSIYRWALLPLTILLWKKIKRSFRIITVFIVFTEISKWLIKGTNKGIFDVLIIVAVSLIIINYKKSLKNNIKKSIRSIKKANKVVMFSSVIIVFMLVLSLSFFTDNIVGRYDGRLPVQNVDYDSIFYKYTPDILKNTVIAFTGYLVQGYNGLGLAFEIPFSSTFGAGHSTFIMYNIQSLLGIELFSHTYQFRIQEQFGWHSLSNWHTAYLWFANDVSFFGVLVVMFFIGFLFASTWKSYIMEGNPYSFLLIILLAMFFFYISANNQVFSHFQTLFPFLYYFIKWFQTNNLYLWSDV